jgi:1,4-dihydroxy-2-naphthoate octaprenyltransferase
MSFKSFLKLVEIQTKVASVLTCIAGTVFGWYSYDAGQLSHMMIKFVALLSIDMATTAINNYMDYKKAIKQEGYGYEEHNAIVFYNLNEKQILASIVSLLVIGIIFGIILFLMTDWIVLLIGVLSFGVGIVYSFGPLPISRTPFGEVFSGFFMGFFIIFLSVYIHISDLNMIQIQMDLDILTLQIKWQDILYILLYSLPFIAGISNIMLANNICDMEDDFHNKRYTLPILIGKKSALLLFKWTYYLSIVSIVSLILLKVVSISYALGLIMFIPIHSLVKEFENEQLKQSTFVNAVKAFVLTSVVIIVVTAIQFLF